MMQNTQVQPSAGPVQMLTLRTHDELYAVELLRVSEIRRWEGAVRIPNAAPCVLGVTNVRGSIVPVVELRQRLDLGPGEYGKTSVVILLQLGAGAGGRTVGLLVDGVADVLELPRSEVRPPPEGSTHAALVSGLFSIGEKTGVLLCVDELLSAAAGVEASPATQS